MPAVVHGIRADLWHLHFPNPTGEVSYMLAARRAPTVVTYHSDIVRQAWALSVYRPIVEAVLKRTDVIMPTSDAYIERSPFLRKHRDRCKPVPLGIEIERFVIDEATRLRAADIRAAHKGP